MFCEERSRDGDRFLSRAGARPHNGQRVFLAHVGWDGYRRLIHRGFATRKTSMGCDAVPQLCGFAFRVFWFLTTLERGSRRGPLRNLENVLTTSSTNFEIPEHPKMPIVAIIKRIR